MPSTATFTLGQLRNIFGPNVNANNIAGVRALVQASLNANTPYHFALYDITVVLDKNSLFQITAPHLTSQEILDALN